MSHPLYAEFLRDARQYTDAERYWQALFDDITRTEGVQSEWRRPWLVTRFADGTPFGDGNPIFSAWSPTRSLGVRVIQNEPGLAGGHCEFDSWLDTFDAGVTPIRELVISCVLNEEAAARAAEVMRTWMTRQEQAKPGAGPARTG